MDNMANVNDNNVNVNNSKSIFIERNDNNAVINCNYILL